MRTAAHLQRQWRAWRIWLTLAVFAGLIVLYLVDDRATRWQALVTIGILAALLIFEKTTRIFGDGTAAVGEARFDTRNAEDR